MQLTYSEIIPGIFAYYRADTSDERVLTEVVKNRIYRRVRLNFDVEGNETWLDLGANIGAFALYCQSRHARAVCYEPDPKCFEILKMNAPWMEKHQTAVTNRHERVLEFWKGSREDDHYRATAFPTSNLPKHPSGWLPNMHGSLLQIREYDGVKMDIEGAEAGLLDDMLIPRCKKFCMEYHTSRDHSTERLRDRLNFLKSRFKTVSYPPEFDRLIAQGGSAKTFFDRMVYARDPR